jgi:hypothetical protein
MWPCGVRRKSRLGRRRCGGRVLIWLGIGGCEAESDRKRASGRAVCLCVCVSPPPAMSLRGSREVHLSALLRRTRLCCPRYARLPTAPHLPASRLLSLRSRSPVSSSTSSSTLNCTRSPLLHSHHDGPGPQFVPCLRLISPYRSRPPVTSDSSHFTHAHDWIDRPLNSSSLALSTKGAQGDATSLGGLRRKHYHHCVVHMA